MALWKEPTAPPKEPAALSIDLSARKESEPRPELYSSPTNSARVPDRPARESIIAEEITIEGKIEGSGHVRIAGRFKGDVHVKGNLSIEPGATVTGGVRANTVTIGGQLEGNIEGATRVELLETGILNGDLSADSLTVAAGSRMRGKVEFGWENNGGRSIAPGSDKPVPQARGNWRATRQHDTGASRRTGSHANMSALPADDSRDRERLPSVPASSKVCARCEGARAGVVHGAHCGWDDPSPARR